MGVLDKILRAGEGKVLRKLEGIAKAVNAIESVIKASQEDPTSRALAGRLYRQTKKDGLRSLFRKESE